MQRPTIRQKMTSQESSPEKQWPAHTAPLKGRRMGSVNVSYLKLRHISLLMLCSSAGMQTIAFTRIPLWARTKVKLTCDCLSWHLCLVTQPEKNPHVLLMQYPITNTFTFPQFSSRFYKWHFSCAGVPCILPSAKTQGWMRQNLHHHLSHWWWQIGLRLIVTLLLTLFKQLLSILRYD